MVKSKSFWLATGLRFGQAGNSGLIQTFLAGIWSRRCCSIKPSRPMR
jgi:hypothetical protein